MKNKFMLKAIELSQNNMTTNAGGPFGAVIVKNNKIIAQGWNTVTSTLDPTAHAEVNAIRKACSSIENFMLEGCDIYTSCEPCPMCLSAIYWARIENIYYANARQDAAKIGFDDEFLYQEISTPLENRKIPIHQLNRQEALKVFNLWENKSDKTHY